MIRAALFPVVIIAGGLATRLHPLTQTLPKSLVLINDEPFISHQLRLLHQNGIREVVLCLGYLGEQVVDYIGNGDRFGMHVSYVFDGPILLGTAGSIRQALPQLPEHFFVLNGDSYLPCDYAAVQNTFERSHKQALMTVFRNLGLWDKSNVEFSHHSILAYDKKHQTERMLYIDYGLEIFAKSAFDSIPAQTPYDLADLFQNLLQQQQLAAHEVSERFYEVGSFAGMSDLGHYLTLCR